MDSEKIKTTSGPENLENKINDQDSGENQSEQMRAYDEALADLDTLSADLENESWQTEAGRVGPDKLKQQGSLFDRVKLGLHELFRDRKGQDKQLADMARKQAEEKITELEKLGNEILELKEKITAYEKVSQEDLEAIRQVPDLDPEFIQTMETKIKQESDSLHEDNSGKEQELQEKIAEHPAFRKHEKIESLLEKYDGIEKSLNGRQEELKKSIAGYETAYNSIKGETETSQEMKKHLEEQLASLNQENEEIKNRAKIVRERKKALKEEQEELAPLARKLGATGLTKAEILKRKLSKYEQANGSKNKKMAAGGKPESIEQLKSELLTMPNKSPEEWAQILLSKKTKMIDSDIVSDFKDKSKRVGASVIDGSIAAHLLAQYFIEKKKIRALKDATAKAEEIIEQLI